MAQIEPLHRPGLFNRFRGCLTAAAAAVLTMSAFAVAGGISATSAGAATQPLQVTTTSLAWAGQAAVGYFYEVNLGAVGGTSPYTWSVVSGTLPPGMQLLFTGVLDGRPEDAGTYTFTVGVTDSSSPPQQASQPLTLTVVQDEPLTITTASLPDTSIGKAYSATLQAAGGVQPYGWSLASGALPQGLTLSASGTISGHADLPESDTFVVQVNDGANAANRAPPQSATEQFNITVSSGKSTLDPLVIPIGNAIQGLLDTSQTGGSSVIGQVTGLLDELGSFLNSIPSGVQFVEDLLIAIIQCGGLPTPICS